ncbi:hypothetical protein Bca4012_045746 [Brassica carinata]|uniref:Uncharacterized protein n=3 Tax=Brassica TaxID=3705 RepID=A0A0D3EE28_BRAOL|nr:PREDICTED: uncharacterized protein LOC106318583 [Brassica oleracea var. oleracea]KAG2273490.1 hypothetical protein Bca52824_056045 [Brassica carinata]CAF1778259.1 unnamed protein product [Brassica napus]CDY13991.1 BnaC09g38350D [Brassica napus]
MVVAETAEATMVFTTEGPRISFSADLSSSDSEGDYICINPENLLRGKEEQVKAGDFEFLSNTQTMLTAADELFSEGKLLPFWQAKHSEKLQNVTLKTKVVDVDEVEVVEEEEEEEEDRRVKKEETVHNSTKEQENNNRGSWFLDDDPSPRPPNCTVLWKELLRLKKQRNTKTTNTTTKASSTKASSLSPSSSSSSTSSSSSSIGDAVKEESEKKGKKGLERTRSVTMRIRPMIHVPVCTPTKPPLFPLRLHKNRVEKRT